MSPVIQSYKKVLNFLEASFSPGSNNIFLSQGRDSLAAGQTSNTDGEVPTGAIIKYIEIQFVVANNGANGAFINTAIQYKLEGQSAILATQVGGDGQRNQVLHQSMFLVGGSQNSAHIFRFKVPKKFQRVREKMDWVFSWTNTASVQMSTQVIYKFYR